MVLGCLAAVAVAASLLLVGLPAATGTPQTPPSTPSVSVCIGAELRRRLLGPVVLLGEDSVAVRIACVAVPTGVAMNAFTSATLPALSVARAAGDSAALTAQALV